jgi:hypothetical protein
MAFGGRGHQKSRCFPECQYPFPSAGKEFFAEFPNATKPQILDQLGKMLKDFGLE